jgi:hypothetical protein
MLRLSTHTEISHVCNLKPIRALGGIAGDADPMLPAVHRAWPGEVAWHTGMDTGCVRLAGGCGGVQVGLGNGYTATAGSDVSHRLDR